jgi:ABC-type transport system involved in multi-copper enzyme maturation permease subunit
MENRHENSVGATVRTVASAALRLAICDRSVLLLAAMFMAMAIISAYLGWSATHTLDAIFRKAVPVLIELKLPIPLNPALETSPLAPLRNMTTYVSLLGALSALVLGGQMIAADRKSGVLPLIVSRPVGRVAYAAGKILALVAAIATLLVLSAAVNALSMLLLPGQVLTGEVWRGLADFYGVSLVYLVLFGLIGSYFAIVCGSESLALLIPVTLWLLLTFVVPQLTANINPMAALNPIKAVVPPLGGSFFSVVDQVLGPVSVTEVYRSLSGRILGFAPAVGTARGLANGLTILLLGNLLLGAAVLFAMQRFDASRSDYHD